MNSRSALHHGLYDSIIDEMGLESIPAPGELTAPEDEYGQGKFPLRYAASSGRLGAEARVLLGAQD